jgi:hypothetical protein
MDNTIEILSRLLPRKYWILGITLTITMIGLVIKIPDIKKGEYEVIKELFVINVPSNVKMDFNKYALNFVEKPSVKKALSKKFNLQEPQVYVSFGKNKSICFSAVNSDPNLAQDIVMELIEMFNQKINSIVNETVILNIEKTDYLIALKQQQIDSVKQRLIGLYEQNEMVYTPNSYLSNFDKMTNTNAITKMKPIKPLTAKKGVDLFAEETMLFNCIFDLNQYINRKCLIISQLNIENNYIGISKESDMELPDKAFNLLKFLVKIFIIGLMASISWFLILDFGMPVFKLFRQQLLNQIKSSDKTT